MGVFSGLKIDALFIKAFAYNCKFWESGKSIIREGRREKGWGVSANR
jgi:hypothetical protein